MKIVRESLYESQTDKIHLSAGLAIIQRGAILLAHPKGQEWYGTYTIPKGHVEPGEDILDAAIRETREEVGISIDKSEILNKNPKFIDYKDKSGNIYKRVYYFLVIPKKLIKNEAIIPDNKEIDWAGFILEDASRNRIFWRLKSILKHIEPVSEIEEKMRKKEKEKKEEKKEEEKEEKKDEKKEDK